MNWSVIAKWLLEVFGKGAGSSWAVLISPIEPDLECFGFCAGSQKVYGSVARYSVCDHMSFRMIVMRNSSCEHDHCCALGLQSERSVYLSNALDAPGKLD